MQKQSLELFYEKTILKNFAVFTGKDMCWWLFLIPNIVKFLRALILSTAASENVFIKLRKSKNCSQGILTLDLKKNRIFQHQYQKQVKMFSFIL